MTFSKNCSITLLECFHQHLQGYQKSSYIKEKVITSGGFYHCMVIFAKPGSHTSENRSENHITRRRSRRTPPSRDITSSIKLCKVLYFHLGEQLRYTISACQRFVDNRAIFVAQLVTIGLVIDFDLIGNSFFLLFFEFVLQHILKLVLCPTVV